MFLRSLPWPTTVLQTPKPALRLFQSRPEPLAEHGSEELAARQPTDRLLKPPEEEELAARPPVKKADKARHKR